MQAVMAAPMAANSLPMLHAIKARRRSDRSLCARGACQTPALTAQASNRTHKTPAVLNDTGRPKTPIIIHAVPNPTPISAAGWLRRLFVNSNPLNEPQQVRRCRAYLNSNKGEAKTILQSGNRDTLSMCGSKYVLF
jgi:hypothetical protein